jgi:hypothetical protein
MSIAALGTAVDRRSLPAFKTFLALLHVENGEVRLPENRKA